MIKEKRAIDGHSDIERCFETPVLYTLNKILEKANAQICFMADYFLSNIDIVFQFKPECKFELRILKPEIFSSLYIPEWKNALCKERKHFDVIAVGAYDKEKLVGLAGCSADCDTIWQIGVDVLPEYRMQGIASALTNRIARETFERDYVPFYCVAQM